MTGKRIIEKLKQEAYELLLPDIDVVEQNGELRAVAKGVRGKIFQPMLDYTMKRFNNNKVLARRNGGNIYTLYNPPMPSKAAMRLLERAFKEKIFGIVTPTTVTFAVTYTCPCNCEFCSADRFSKVRGGGDRRVLDTDEAKNAIDQCVDLGCTNITFTGGEPLTRKDFCELVAHVPKDKAVALMFSSGYLMNEENVARLKEAGIYSVMISIDSVYPEKHEEFRRTKGLFEKAWNGAKLLRDAGVLVGISTHASHENIADGSLELLVRKVMDEGFNEITIFDSMPTGRWLKCDDVILGPEEKKRVVDMAKKYVAQPENKTGIIAQPWINGPDGSGCFAGFFQFYLSAYGDVNPCDFHPLTFGNIRQRPLKDIWASITNHPEYGIRKWNCRMQSPSFRARYIDSIPDDVDLPIDISFVGNVTDAVPDEPTRSRTVGVGR